MLITVDRFVSDDDATLSRVLIDGAFCCFGLEDEYRAVKVARETRIPAGQYRVKLRTEGGFHNRYAQRFSRQHHGMLHVVGVPNFRYILIHVGNTDEDSAGCLLVGTGCSGEYGDMRLTSSVRGYLLLYAQVIDAALDRALHIEYLDNDGHRQMHLA